MGRVGEWEGVFFGGIVTFFSRTFKLELSELAPVPMATKNVEENLAPSASLSEALPRRDNKL